MNHPIQPLEKDKSGVMRFKSNAIVRALLDHSQATGFGLNEIARMQFSDEDSQQLAQLIGYSLCGYCELSYVDDTAYAAAEAMAENPDKDTQQARIEVLEKTLRDLKSDLRTPMAVLFGIHPDDLGGTE